MFVDTIEHIRIAMCPILLIAFRSSSTLSHSVMARAMRLLLAAMTASHVIVVDYG